MMWTVAFAWLTGAAFGQTADEIVERARAANQVDRSIQSVTMTIVSKSGSKRIRDLELKSRRDAKTTASYIEVKAPADVAGTKLLSLESPNGKEEQIMKLPSISGVRRISGSNKKGTFLGSDFTYEDLGIRDLADGTHTLAEDEAETWVIETKPNNSAQYGKIRAHITKSDLVARKIELFNKDGEMVKVLEVTETTTQGDVTLPQKTVMRSVKKGRHTVLAVTEQRIEVSDSELPARVFTAEYLER
ncbi:MAG: outer membrane lipoprotein-sorting protein [Myxococcota bacterium]